jgi:hypothetical protein
MEVPSICVGIVSMHIHHQQCTMDMQKNSSILRFNIKWTEPNSFNTPLSISFTIVVIIALLLPLTYSMWTFFAKAPLILHDLDRTVYICLAHSDLYSVLCEEGRGRRHFYIMWCVAIFYNASHSVFVRSVPFAVCDYVNQSFVIRATPILAPIMTFNSHSQACIAYHSYVMYSTRSVMLDLDASFAWFVVSHCLS